MATGTHYSTQRANDVAVPSVANSPTTRGNVKRVWFDGTLVIASNGDAGSTLHLCKLPAGVRVVGGSITVDATFVATGNHIIGIAGTTNKYMTNTDLNNAATYAFANTAAWNCGTVTTAEEEVIFTNSTGALGNGGTFFGWIDYIQ